MNADPLSLLLPPIMRAWKALIFFRYTPTTVKSSVEPYRVVLKVLPTAFSTPNSILALSVSMTTFFFLPRISPSFR